MIKGMVAIVGRPNVGKSTLFNCLTRKEAALVDDRPGVTRDRIYGTVYYPGSDDNGFVVIDTGGFETKDYNFQPFAQNIVWQQTEYAIDEADVVVFLLDGKSGLHPHDHDILNILKRKEKKILYVVNKIDGVERTCNSLEFYALGGVDEILSVSAAHSKGIVDLKEKIQEELYHCKNQHKAHAHPPETVQVALIGRPNAGKSSILNRLLGEERSIVSDVPGTTRDSLDSYMQYNHKPYLIIDTAGLRRKSRISDVLETQCTMRSIRAIERADIVVAVLDAIGGVTDQDTRLINLATARHKPVLIVINKWDLIPEKTSKTQYEYARSIHEHLLKDQSFLPIHFTSCLKNQRVHDIMSWVERLTAQSSLKVSTSFVNKILEQLLAKHSPHLRPQDGRPIKFYFGAQVATNPPTLILMCNRADEVRPAYKRYLVKGLQQDLGFNDVPLKVILRNKHEAGKRDPLRNNPTSINANAAFTRRKPSEAHSQ